LKQAVGNDAREGSDVAEKLSGKEKFGRQVRIKGI